MPKVISYTPSWLSRPSPGFQVFNRPETAAPRDSVQEYGNTKAGHYLGPNKTIAQRGTEIFTVAGKHIRWSDLCMLKDEFEKQSRTPSKKPKPVDGKNMIKEDDGPEDGSYRVLKVPINEQIRQLSVSPNGNLLAISTSHTVHIAIIPNSSHLGQIPNETIKLKTYTIGPTTHVLSQSQVTNILWHPCGVVGNCLVTITADAVVRLWEFNRDNRWSSDSPSLAVDLKKLVVGSSEEENFAPDKFGRNRGFSSDDAGMEVASACFGGTGSSAESGWSAMTLWVAMKGGDVYALCPFLPSKWQPSATLISSLSMAAVAKAASKQLDDAKDSGEERQYRDQLDWVRDVDGQDSMLLDPVDESSPEVYSRPSHPGSIPRLQGPFQIFPEDTELDLELSDIHVIAAKLDAEEFLSGDDSDSEADPIDEHGVSASIIALMTKSGRVYVCLDLEGVEGQWLPRKKPKRPQSPPVDPYLIVLEGLDTLSPNDLLDLQWPTFSQNLNSTYTFFATHSNAVFFFSLEPWLKRLEKELQSNEILGGPFRTDIIKNGPGTLRQRILPLDQDRESASEPSASACLVFQDSDLGYLLLTSVDGQPRAATLDEPFQEPAPNFDAEEESHIQDMNQLSLGPARAIYQPPDSFYADSSLPKFLGKHVHNRHKRTVTEEVRLSTATLDLMTRAHRVLSQETHRLGVAASDLFRRCQRLQDELRDQISRANEVAQRTEKIAGEDSDRYLDSIRGKSSPSLDERLEKVQSRHEELAARHEALRKKLGKAGKELSEKEKLWTYEVDKTRDVIASPDPEHEDDEELASDFWKRCREAEDLKQDLVTRAKEISTDNHQMNGDDGYTIPLGLRKEKIAQVKMLLERESELVEAAGARLERLNLAIMS